ncbi:MAG: hypothetical protein JXR84_17645 [Anaerolineae bacterium]|nr:hypothetical protein [Anaerolineae bacterium]
MSVVVAAGALGTTTTCSGEGNFTVTGGTVSGSGLPVFEITAQLNGSFPVTCNGISMGGSSSDSLQLTLENLTASGNTVTGEKGIFTPDRFGWGVSQMQDADASVDVSESWELTNTAPFLNDLDAQYERYFLETVSVNNHYRATVDWNGNAPGYMTFAGAGQSTNIGASGETVDFNLNSVARPSGYTA